MNAPSVKERRALITGITGQDGSYLAEFLLEKGYQVSGMVRRASTENVDRIAHIAGDINLVQGDLLDQLSLMSVVEETRPTSSTTWPRRASSRRPGASPS